MKNLNTNIAIQLTGVSKQYTRYPGGYRLDRYRTVTCLVYRIHHEKPTLVEKLVNGRDEEFWALKILISRSKKGSG